MAGIINTLSNDYHNELKNLERRYNNLSNREKLAFEQNLNKYDYDKVKEYVENGSYGPDDVFSHVFKKVIEMEYFDFNLKESDFKEIIFENKTLQPKGTKSYIYKDYKQGESPLNTDPVGVTIGKTPRTGYDEVDYSAGGDLAPNFQIVYEQGAKVDTEYSNKYSIPDKILDTWTLNPVSFAKAVQDVRAAVKAPWEIYKKQVAIKTLAERAENGDIENILYSPDTIYTDENDGKVFVRELKNLIWDIQKADSRHFIRKNILPNTDQNLVYVGDGRKFILYMDYKLKPAIDVNVLSGVFQLDKMALPEGVEVKFVNFSKWAEWVPGIALDGGKINFMIIEKGLYDTLWLYDDKTIKKTETSRMYTQFNQYCKYGIVPIFNKYFSIGISITTSEFNKIIDNVKDIIEAEGVLKFLLQENTVKYFKPEEYKKYVAKIRKIYEKVEKMEIKPSKLLTKFEVQKARNEKIDKNILDTQELLKRIRILEARNNDR